jgi:hypothetical protein
LSLLLRRVRLYASLAVPPGQPQRRRQPQRKKSFLILRRCIAWRGALPQRDKNELGYRFSFTFRRAYRLCDR